MRNMEADEITFCSWPRCRRHQKGHFLKVWQGGKPHDLEIPACFLGNKTKLKGMISMMARICGCFPVGRALQSGTHALSPRELTYLRSLQGAPSEKAYFILQKALRNAQERSDSFLLEQEIIPFVPLIFGISLFSPPSTVEEILRHSQWALALTKSMEYLLEIAWETSPFFHGHRRHAEAALPFLDVDARCYRDVLDALGKGMRNINAKIEAAHENWQLRSLKTISPFFKDCQITYCLVKPSLGAGPSLRVDPPLNFCYFSMDQVVFKDLHFPSASGHFDHAVLRGFRFEGDWEVKMTALMAADFRRRAEFDDEVNNWKLEREDEVAVTRL